MSNRIHTLAQQLTGKTSVEECSVEEVRQIAQRYPYFAPAQFLLVQKLKETASPDLEVHQRKAVLFSPDPLLFDYFISSDTFYSDETVSENEPALPSINVDGRHSVMSDNEDAILSADANDSTGQEPVITGDPLENIAIVEEEEVEPEVLAQNNPPSTEAMDTEQNTKDGFQTTNFENTIALSANDNKLQNDTPELNITDNSLSEEKKVEADVTEQPVTPLKEELVFEPFHTVDYFASQGIKISADGLTNDRLGKQLKSFTDWLKTMKRLPAVQINEPFEMIAERKVENMASRSVSESSIVTEAMAEVWARQGNKEKAAEIYNKLSLLNPSKKAFFAAKIENLKSF